jgi:hypothetical protein
MFILYPFVNIDNKQALKWIIVCFIVLEELPDEEEQKTNTVENFLFDIP